MGMCWGGAIDVLRDTLRHPHHSLRDALLSLDFRPALEMETIIVMIIAPMTDNDVVTEIPSPMSSMALQTVNAQKTMMMVMMSM